MITITNNIFHGDFNPRSREGSDPTGVQYLLKQIDFNPRSREGSDVDKKSIYPVTDSISIHAPARGATVL